MKKNIYQRAREKISNYLITLTSQNSEKHAWDMRCYLLKRALIWRHVSRAKKQEEIRALSLVIVIEHFVIFFGPGLKHMFEESLKLVLSIPK